VDQQHEGARLYHFAASAHHLVCFAATVLLNDLIRRLVEIGLKVKGK
jgi:hypothetical protein